MLHCRPPLDARPLRLPVIDDYLNGTVATGQRMRGSSPGDLPLLQVKQLSKSFFVREGWFGKREFQAVRDVSFSLARGKTLGVVGESGSGKSTLGLTLLRLHQASGGSALFEGRDLLAMSARIHGLQAAHPDHFPESLRLAQPAFYCRPDPDGADAHPRHRRRRRARAELARALLDKVGLLGPGLRALSARVFRRTAPAHRDRALPDHAARDPRVRRVGVGARRVGPGAGAQPAAGLAGRVRPELHLHLARPVGGALHGRPGDGDAPGQRGGTGRRGYPVQRAAASSLPGPARRHSPRPASAKIAEPCGRCGPGFPPRTESPCPT
ncbi:ATP-binding cassette domain-containing protein [Massilia sp. B-10]|nr:ATP-binding cassette domain-containing protein [Massilia sp. B-10]